MVSEIDNIVMYYAKYDIRYTKYGVGFELWAVGCGGWRMKDARSFHSLGRRRKDDRKKKGRSSKRTK